QRGDQAGQYWLQAFHIWNDSGMGELSAMVGARIRELRAARGWSLSSLAERAGVGKATLSEIESGQRNPTLETLYAIAAPLRVGLSALLAEPPEAPSVHGDAV